MCVDRPGEDAFPQVLYHDLSGEETPLPSTDAFCSLSMDGDLVLCSDEDWPEPPVSQFLADEVFQKRAAGDIKYFARGPPGPTGEHPTRSLTTNTARGRFKAHSLTMDVGLAQDTTVVLHKWDVPRPDGSKLHWQAREWMVALSMTLTAGSRVNWLSANLSRGLKQFREFTAAAFELEVEEVEVSHMLVHPFTSVKKEVAQGAAGGREGSEG